VSESIKDSIDAYIKSHGITADEEPRHTPVWEPAETTADTAILDIREAGSTAIVWATGFGTDNRWIEIPVFDGRGYPTHQRGVTSCPGLYFLGLPWQHTWGSGRFSGVGADAEYLARRITAFHAKGEVSWIAGTQASTFPPNDDHAYLTRDDDWTAPRTVA
jgi:putative flavoprotein involved in K+ transport